jgi:hypothetical protein
MPFIKGIIPSNSFLFKNKLIKCDKLVDNGPHAVYNTAPVNLFQNKMVMAFFIRRKK